MHLSYLNICTIPHLKCFLSDIADLANKKYPKKVDTDIQPLLSQEINNTLIRIQERETQKRSLNLAVNQCLKAYYDSRSQNQDEYYQRNIMLDWAFKYAPCYSRTDKLAVVKRLYERNYLTKKDIEILSSHHLGQALLDATKIKSTEMLLAQLDYIDDVNEEGAKCYRWLSIDFEPCLLVSNELEDTVKVSNNINLA